MKAYLNYFKLRFLNILQYRAAAISKLSGSYWCLVAAVFLVMGLGFDKWEFAAVIFPVAGVLFVAVLGIIKIMADKD